MREEWREDLPFIPGTLMGKKRERAIAEHLRWLANRGKFDEDRMAGTPLHAWTTKHVKEVAISRSFWGYYKNTK
jgi:hypothetical protein